MTSVEAEEKLSPRKAEIVRVAGRLFAERGFQGTSLRDIGEAVDIRRGSLYSHFSSKEEILKILLTPAVNELRDLLSKAYAAPKSGRERLELAMSEALECSRRHRDAILILFQDRQLIDDSPALNDISAAAKTIAPIWISCITAGQGDGSIRTDIAPATIALALISLLVGALSDRHLGIYSTKEGRVEDRSELGRLATSLIFEGIIPR